MEIKSENRKKKIENRRADIRYLNDMKMVLYDKSWAKNASNLELYYMYRGVKPPHLLIGGGGKKEGTLRYDITIIPPRMLGREFVKTKGHEHSNNYEEVYQVLKGEALYLLQKYQKNKIQDVYTIKAKRDNAVIIPPGYGHITINPSKKELIEANWLNEKCKNIYDLFVKKAGACYYYTKNGWIKNKNYKKVPKLRFKKPLKSMPKDLSFLK
ncbi:MAG: glucose-6-phosphate isomerase [Candidatus Nealsonbacteria bacterium CG_4_9_14_0_2_um_filter_37_38]|uniref:glucose-6-phosphate isomerase n=1 Tax=Candidatus Nealsonbacteria bacterium CG_4_10_14_0_8_um_filter_37_14 TaxID=1974684 RepID=A0A2M7R6G1_9BACT|nr:MAG: glucose-6-phosphate isomerase [Candidatus Nealsonbacteria bacterium CG11_big_fil_rev_8_21_14_0_20_37_68]PIW91872.1 MAG: glucose-6-phosphate isomerase [Candidatus Nealsonbacteria bacterium CG_4_8_14_3_um_filter_37_23]PIY89194.1 MAG: glucose-6-phosphate isomerase [Candidatus Nealsonbacteria bacterium CG_4_10_14_0_8_um_filter_37_14]PJC51614.1 MAG: glucose-6-phosphate isomerase [Candidatus Nealsonbacteria bacterium CG_4_9_14_0_2_um_filter_37_38]